MNGTELERRISEANRVYNPFIRSYLDQNIKHSSGLPFSGKSFAVKDCIAVKGAPLSFGMKPPLIEKSDLDAEVVALLRSKGAFLVGSTNLDEACLNFYGDNRHYGRINSAIDPRYTATGSSGGSAVAVALGLVDFALGTDIGGSMRAPAAANGICGLMPTRGFFSPKGVLSLAPSMDSVGVFTKTLKELIFFVEKISGSDPEPAQFIFKRIIIPSKDELSSLTPEIGSAFESFIKTVSARVEVLQSLKPLGFDEARQIRRALATVEIAQTITNMKLDSERLPREARLILANRGKITEEKIQSAKRDLLRLEQSISEIFTAGGVIISPTLPADPPSWEQIDMGLIPANPYMGYFLSLPSLVGSSTLSLSLGKRESLFPASIQVMGQKARDLNMLYFIASLFS